MMEAGYAAPIVRIFNSSDTLVIEGVSRFKYVSSELVDDASFITIESDNTALIDHPDFQEHKQIKVMWGYNGSGVFQKRIVYIWDLKTTFDENGIRMELECYCKAAYLKLNSSKDVFDSNSTFEDVAKTFTDAYGLNYKTENLDPETEPSNIERIEFGGRTESITDFENGRSTIARDNTAYIVEKYKFKEHPDGIPQANRSDKKLLNDLAAFEPIDNLFLDGRDDDLIIKRRDFLQKPYKSYQWKAEPGHLLSFTPASKNASNKKHAISNSVNGWLEDEKEYLQGQIDRSQSGAGVLGDMVELSLETNLKNRLQEEMQNPFDRPLSVDGLMQEEYEGVGPDGNPITRMVVTEKLDTTKQAFVMFHKRGTQPSQLQLDKKFPMYSAAIDNTGRIETRGFVVVDPKEYIPTVESKPKDIAGAGVNRQSAQELELNEGNAKVVGDPTLVCSRVISFLGLGKRYSGNYYIFAVEHEITKESGYLCYLKHYRTGQNKLGSEDQSKSTANELGFIQNTDVINSSDGTNQLVIIPVVPDA